jgi:hypothetical protein
LILEEEDLPFPNLFVPFSASTCKQSKPQTANTTQNKLTQNAISGILLLLQTKRLQPNW